MSFTPPNQARYEASAAVTREAEDKAAHYAHTHPDGPKRRSLLGRLLDALRHRTGKQQDD
jgi:hypothetical protein